ncbi:biotin synthase [Campylobacter fetus subsp. testudinum]|uniref:Biotin synthase n=2 Tax=Campylobacter fetus TaxID=196 RepID=A0AAX0H955_CAMFE|nr:biotin synthase [Campylobacter fetus subsp. testudinum]OCR87603.1 biotin synthase [Campylobacter fetus subsp. testudinum]OCR90069.1 biotin synthase [Campylobacter fetus subsp. testudinum]OCR91869.1 biotin synthase [Campylobacter fetus subsp. testudinum]OCR95550.1 biotin synthase [Campylobacter fetus subsp. testudinum]
MTMSKMVMLCAICNVSSGNCAEDCAYCTQSAHIKADIPKFKQKNLEQILNEAKIASKNHALGFCLVTSGLGLDDKKLEFICEAATMLRKETPNLMLIACNGSASYESLKELKKVGIFSYNHNLETSREFFPQICTTHSWDDRFNTNLNAKKAGLELCCGGIYGLGESLDDRLSFRASLKELNPFSSPINFFIPNSALKIKQPLLSTDEALEIIRDTAKTLPQCRIMVAGGREVVLGDRQYEILENGASAIVIGDYLTTSGEVASRDIEELRKRGFEFASQCH